MGFGLLVVFLVGMSWFALEKLNGLARLTVMLYDHPMTVSNAAREFQTSINHTQLSIRDLAREDSEMLVKNELDNLELLEKDSLRQLDVMEERFLGDKKTVRELREMYIGWQPVLKEAVDLVKQGKQAESIALTRTKGAEYMKKLEDRAEYFIKFANNKALEFFKNAETERTAAIRGLVFGLIFTAVIALAISFLITQSIVSPINEAVRVAESLACNDISIEIAATGNRDEAGKLLNAMKEMLDNLKKQLKSLTEGINVLAASASEISSTTSQFASSFNEIASSISETVTSMKEVKQTAEASNEKARFVSQGAQNIVQVSKNGERSVTETVSAMTTIQEQMTFIAESIVGLSEQTQSIGDIIAVVDDIAEQSRLLAVNASIEAVKAGEQGKGFSVVAGEIKNLAQQSKESTNQVRGILGEIQKATSHSVMVTEKGNKSVDNGVKQARQTGEAIEVLGRGIHESSQATLQIEATIRQQLAGIDQVFAAMESINVAIRQNYAGARQLESAAANLEDLGGKLKALSDKYRI